MKTANAEVATMDELQNLVSEISVKGKMAGAESISRLHSLVAYKSNVDAVTMFGSYVDMEKKASTSMAGLMIQINSRLKKKFGKAAESMSGNELNVLAMIRMTIARIIQEGMLREESRRIIKDRCYHSIETIYNATMMI